MIRALPLLVLAAALIFMSGCTTPTSPPSSFRFPRFGAKTFPAADGRTWVMEKYTVDKGTHWISFTPKTAPAQQWPEQLSFGLAAEHMSRTRYEEGLKSIRKDYDPDLTFAFEGTDEVYVVTYYSPKWKEHAVMKVVRTADGLVCVNYRERLQEAGARKFAAWSNYIRELPTEAMQATRPPPPPPLFSSELKLMGSFNGDRIPVLVTKTVPNFVLSDSAPKGGVTEVELIVETDGTVKVAQVVTESIDGFGTAVTACVKQWRFQPGAKQGTPIRTPMVLTFTASRQPEGN